MATPETVFPITVDYTKSLAEMIAAGEYDDVHQDITAQNFPLKGRNLPPGRQGTVNIEIVLYRPYFFDIEDGSVLKKMDQAGLRPARLPELCAFGAKYPEKQRELPIAAVGSSWEDLGGRRRVACLHGLHGKRDLDLFYWDGQLRMGGPGFLRRIDDYSFAAIRK